VAVDDHFGMSRHPPTDADKHDHRDGARDGPAYDFAIVFLSSRHGSPRDSWPTFATLILQHKARPAMAAFPPSVHYPDESIGSAP
jgi:hypothetical protein